MARAAVPPPNRDRDEEHRKPAWDARAPGSWPPSDCHRGRNVLMALWLRLLPEDADKAAEYDRFNRMHLTGDDDTSP